ncbi:hypothetical protein FACS1894105_09970 [Clostridia bacterium]|nr:hypothetical protein FACS1894105_09970 [Clostridia bacterium]
MFGSSTTIPATVGGDRNVIITDKIVFTVTNAGNNFLKPNPAFWEDNDPRRTETDLTINPEYKPEYDPTVDGYNKTTDPTATAPPLIPYTEQEFDAYYTPLTATQRAAFKYQASEVGYNLSAYVFEWTIVDNIAAPTATHLEYTYVVVQTGVPETTPPVTP